MRRGDGRAFVLTWAVTALLLLAVPLLNGYPLVYSDTGTYLRTAFEGYVPPDRPIWYGLFIRSTSLNGTTLWGPVLVQCLLAAWVVVQVTRLGRTRNAPLVRMPLLAAGLVAFTGISWYAGQLMPDIFTGIGIGCVLLLVARQLERRERLAAMLLLVLSIAFHAGNAPILLLSGVGLLPFVVAFQRTRLPALAGVLLVIAAGWWLSPFAGQLVTGGQAARPAHVFLMGRLVDSRVLGPMLKERCPEAGWELCAWRDRLPSNSQDFLWNPESPVHAMGGWEATRQEYGTIVREALTTPDHLFRFLGNTFSMTGSQLADWHMGNGLLGTWYASPDSPPHHQVAKHLPHELGAYRASVMNTNEGRARRVLHAADLLLRLGGVLSLAALLVVLLHWKTTPSDAHLSVLVVLLALVVNALVCAGVSTVADRFQTRMSWVVPLVLWPLALDLLQRRRSG